MGGKMNVEGMNNLLDGLANDEDNKPLHDWLSEFTKKPDTIRLYYGRFKVYLEWIKKTPKQLVIEFDKKQVKSLLLQFQGYLVQKYKNNTARSILTTAMSFYASQCEPITMKRKLIQIEGATGQHIFSTEDLRKMWHVANTRNKAILAVGCSLGWDVSLILAMDRNFFENLVKRARSEKQDFIAFDWTRPKTQSSIYGILNPCAIDSLERYLEKTKDIKSERLWHDLTTEDAINDVLKSLVQEAGIVTIGTIRWHLLKKWLMSQLDRAGLSEFENKTIIGKKIPITDSTYLQTLKRNAFEKYQKAYPIFLSPVAYSNGNGKVTKVQDDMTILARALTRLIQEQKQIEGLSLMTHEDTMDFLRTWVTTEELGLGPRKQKKKEPKSETPEE